MGFSMLFIFAVLQISLLYAEVNSSSSISTEDLSNIHRTDSSNHHHRQARGHTLNASAMKNKDQSILDLSTYLELSEDPVLVSIEDETYYIRVKGKCNDVNIDVIKSSDAPSKDANNQFIVNKDNFEILEWNTWEDIQNEKIPFNPVVICKKIYITKEKQNFISRIKNFFKNTNKKTEILTLNNDIKLQRLEIDNYKIEEENLSNTSQVLKHFIAENRNCKSAKHVVKFDQGSDRSRSFLKSRTHAFGVAIEASVSGQIPSLVDLAGKVSVKYDHSRLTSEMSSKLDKVQHSVSMETEIPPNHSCTIDITSTTFIFLVPYSGQLIRKYKNNEERTTNIIGMYDHQEVAELLASVNPCTPLPDGTKC